LVMGLIYVMDDAGFKGVAKIEWLSWTAFGVTLYAGLSMVTNAPFYSFKAVGGRKTVPFIVLVAIALGIAIISIHPPIVGFALFCAYGLSGYAVYGWRKFKGKPTSVIAMSTDDPDEKGLHP
jgi:CDP-diacylglycerol---serine O-phosphatidyltransferase